MNRFLFFIFALCLSEISHAQYGRFVISVATGPSIPVGAFGSESLANSYAGYAKAGLNVKGAFGFRLTRFAGVGILVTHSDNPFNTQSFIQNNNVPGVIWNGTSGSWKATGGFIGIFYSIPVKRFMFDIKAYRGIMACTSPQLTLNSKDNQYHFTQSSGSGFSPYAYDFGTSVKYVVGESKKVFVSGNFDFLYAQPNFYGIQTTAYTPGSAPSSQSGSFSQPYSNIMVSFGVGVILGKETY